MKSAYELALERLEQQGIEKPRAEGLPAEVKAAMAEARAKAESKLAELEIMHRDRLAGLGDPAARREEEEGYLRERRRVEERREENLETLRRQS